MRLALNRVPMAILGIVIAALGPAAAAADDLAYAQIDAVYGLPGTPASPPPPGSFDAILASLGRLTLKIPPDPALSAGPPFDSLFDPFRLTTVHHYAFWNGLWRVDDPLTQRATIARPDKNELIFLDLAAKTYRMVTGPEAESILKPSIILAALQKSEAKQPYSATQTVTVTTTVTTLAPVPIDGIVAPGVTAVTVIKAPAVGEVCPLFDESSTIASYVDPAHAEPIIAAPGAVQMSVMAAVSEPACRSVLAPSPTAAPLAIDGRLVIYQRMVTSTANSVTAPPLRTTSLMVRGHIRTLGAGDAGLFEIPAGFSPVVEPTPRPR